MHKRWHSYPSGDMSLAVPCKAAAIRVVCGHVGPWDRKLHDDHNEDLHRELWRKSKEFDNLEKVPSGPGRGQPSTSQKRLDRQCGSLADPTSSA